MILYCIADNVQAIFDIWILGDEFVKEVFSEFESIKLKAKKDRNIPPLYIQEYYNVIPYYVTSGVPNVAARLVNSLVEALNERDRLPKFIIVMIDRDLIMNIDVFQNDAVKVLRDVTQWVVHQMNILVRRRKAELLEKKPGAVYTGDPSIIFMKMICRIDKFTPRSKLDLVYGLRAKFNDALNAGAARIEQHMLTLNSCNTSSHFDIWGKLSHRGRSAIWHEIDDLLERFDEGRVKLLLAR